MHPLQLSQESSSTLLGSRRVPQTNTAFVLQRPREFGFEERAVPTLKKSTDVLVRVIATGICGSDVHWWQHGRIGSLSVTAPIVLGHESSGIIEAVGPDVKDLEVGDRVALEPGISCNTCEMCRSGKYNLCDSMQFAATPPYDGTLSTFYVLPEFCCFKLPPSVSFEEGALVEPLSVAVHVCKLAGVGPCSSLVVFGAGPIGLLCCAVARAFGATDIVIADIVEPRLHFAEEYVNATPYLLSSERPQDFNPQEMMSMLGSSVGADVVIDATGVGRCIDYGLQVLRRGGTFLQAGLGPARIDFPIAEICNKEAIFKGSFRYGPGDYKLAIDLLRTGKVQVKDLVTHRYSFADAERAFLDASRRLGIKCIIAGPGVNPTSDEGGLADSRKKPIANSVL